MDSDSETRASSEDPLSSIRQAMSPILDIQDGIDAMEDMLIEMYSVAPDWTASCLSSLCGGRPVTEQHFEHDWTLGVFMVCRASGLSGKVVTELKRSVQLMDEVLEAIDSGRIRGEDNSLLSEAMMSDNDIFIRGLNKYLQYLARERPDEGEMKFTPLPLLRKKSLDTQADPDKKGRPVSQTESGVGRVGQQTSRAGGAGNGSASGFDPSHYWPFDAKRVRELNRGLKSFGRAMDERQTDLTEWIASAESLLKRAISSEGRR